MADKLWLMTRIREEEEEECHLSHSLSFRPTLIKRMNPLQMSLEYEKCPTQIDLEYTPQKQRI